MKCFYLDYCIICFVSSSETWGSVVGVKMECTDDTSSSRQTLLKGYMYDSGLKILLDSSTEQVWAERLTKSSLVAVENLAHKSNI